MEPQVRLQLTSQGVFVEEGYLPLRIWQTLCSVNLSRHLCCELFLPNSLEKDHPCLGLCFSCVLYKTNKEINT